MGRPNLRLSLLPRERLSQLLRPPLRLMLKLTQRLTHGCTTLDLDTTVLDTMDMPHLPTAMPHTPTLTPMPTMERDLPMLRPKLTQRPMLTPISSMVDTTDLTLIMLVTTHTPMDTHTPTDFGERSKSKLSHSLLK